MNQKTPRVSIITPSYNQGQYIEATIQSVLRQGSVDVEHIVVDGGSTDETLDVLRRYGHVKWVSEADRGQADALNKGLALASGDIIGWLNSDDLYVEDILSDVVAEFRNPATQWVIGNLTQLYESTNTTVARRSPVIGLKSLIRDPDLVRQPPAFFRREVLQKVGAWDARFHLAMDFDLWTRLLKVATPVMVNKQWAIFRIHRLQKTSPKNLMAQLSELTEIMRREGASGRQVLNLRLRRWYSYGKLTLKYGLIGIGVLSRKYENRPLRIPRSTAE